MMHHISRIGWTQAVLGTAALALALSIATSGIAFGQDEQGLAIGQYEAQRAFQQAGYQQIMQQKMQELQQQQGQNRQQQAQQAQQVQQQVIQKFQEDVKAVAPDVAEEAQVNALIQGEVLYAEDSTASKDVTDAVTEALKKENDAPEQGDQPSPQQRLQRQ